MADKPELSIVILNYNTKDLTMGCIASLNKVKNESNFEIILCDNASTDGSVEAITQKYPQVKIIENEANLGFAKGNNAAKDAVYGKYVLFLNTDTLVSAGVFTKTLQYLKVNPEVGAITCKMVLSDGSLDRDARRSFPTPWVSFTHLILRIDRLFPKSKLFSKYWYGYIPDNITHEIDVIQGAFFLTYKKILDDVGWFSEDYFLDGEDIDLSWKIKEKGFKLIYYPEVSILHLKGATKGKNKKVQKSTLSFKEKLKFRMSGVNSMELFYKKRLWRNYPALLNYFVLLGIKLMKLVRVVKLIFE